MSFSDLNMSASSTPGPSNLLGALPENSSTVLNLEVLLNLLQQQMVQHQDLMAAIQAQQQDQQTLMNTVQMHLQNSAPIPALAPVVATSNPTAKFPDPTAFTGKPSGVHSYIAKIKSHFMLYPNLFNSNLPKLRILVCGSRMKTASKWFMGVTHADATLLNDFACLKGAFEKHFGDVDYVETVHRKLCALRHTAIGKAAKYAAEFKCIKVDCQHSNYDYRSIYFDGLHNTIQAYLIIDVPDNLDTLMAKSIEIDLCLFKMISHRKIKIHTKSQPPLNPELLAPSTQPLTPSAVKPSPAPSLLPPNPNGSGPMEIDVVRITEAEKNHHR
ncbi:uncharacterized protein EI90DRAFT_3017372 [Cantharellus anzutake]|uniref:uncharacterized protein n=1 Tax=Cantharellus anzutake TaxID=1750568 RepID=UPI001905A901|nr:uncharacterized protein EI90DRAFT_3017372 [Cantharellus anzutake]KAF8329133.1 hypothetical protein EI90DRAFT_3017372 [Cantharellus anzutake]